MNQRLTRKEIKRDEFTAAVGKSVEYAGSHVRPILLAIAGVLVLVAAGIGIWAFLQHRSTQANESLAEAMEVYRAPIEATGARPDDPQEPSFPDEAARRAGARERFEAVHEKYGGTDAGDVAALYLAQIAVEEGQLDRARALWEEFVEDGGDHILAQQARINLLRLDLAAGKAEEVVTELRGMLEREDPPLPRDVALFELASALEEAGRGAEAVPHYREIVEEFPQSPFLGEAQQRLAALDPGSAGGGVMPLPSF